MAALTSNAQPGVFAVEAGGSVTRATLAGPAPASTLRVGTLNPASDATADMVARWSEIFRWVRDAAGPICVGWIGAAAVAPDNAGPVVAAVRRAARTVGLSGQVALANDVTPLLLGPPLDGTGFAVVAGTGSACLASAGNGEVVRVGGHEYVLSDEGSGYQIGLAGLRAALRGLEGTAPDTALRSRCADLPAYARYLATSPQAKAEIAAFAVHVLDCWAEDDPIATAIVEGALDDLCRLVAAAARRIGTPATRVVLTGSLPFHNELFVTGAIRRLRAAEPSCVVTVLADALAPCLALAQRWPVWPTPAEGPAQVHVVTFDADEEASP